MPSYLLLCKEQSIALTTERGVHSSFGLGMQENAVTYYEKREQWNFRLKKIF